MKELLINFYQLNGYVTSKNNDGISHEESIQTPSNGGNCYNYVLGHIILHRSYILTRLDSELKLSDNYEAAYAQGVKQSDYSSILLPFQNLVGDFESSQTSLLEVLNKIDDSFLQTEFNDKPRIKTLTKLTFHESYHVGQLSLLRRFLGKDGVIS